jgi:PadR family transcriptional regulator, regulatory protein PadR
MLLWELHRRVIFTSIILKGNLDLMVLKTLEVMGALHGYGIARRIEQASGDTILLNQGTIYASLVRLQQRGLIHTEWGVSSNNRRAPSSTPSRGMARAAWPLPPRIGSSSRLSWDGSSPPKRSPSNE